VIIRVNSWLKIFANDVVRSIMDHKEAYLSKPWLKYYPKDVPHEVDVPDISVPEIPINSKVRSP
jgi:hypothetical protein